MVIVEAQVETGRSSRYLVQLCRHVHKAGRARPQMQARVEWSDDRGVISLDQGRCTLRALPGVLALRVEAPDEDTLRRLQHRVADRLERIGGRDRLTVTWTLPQSSGEEPAEPPARGDRTRADPHMAVMREDPDNHADNQTRHRGRTHD
jgi:hypothetical protein